jgi:hypothetical protein
MPSSLAALTTAVLILIAGFFIVAAVMAWARARIRNRTENDSFAAGRAIGAMFQRHFDTFAEENPRASLFMSLISGFFAGANR